MTLQYSMLTGKALMTGVHFQKYVAPTLLCQNHLEIKNKCDIKNLNAQHVH